MNNKFDTIIVGGGPAGATAAYYLGEVGQNVLVLEKDSLPRYKACGGGVSAALLDQLPFNVDSIVDHTVSKLAYSLGNKIITIPLVGQSVKLVMRDRFDAFLMDQCKAELHQKTTARTVEEYRDRVTVTAKDGKRYEGDYLIAADGAHSVVAHSLGLRRGKILAGALEIEALLPDRITNRFKDEILFIFGDIPNGYSWIFPKSDHLSIGIGALRSGPGQLQITLKQVMERYGISIEGLRYKGHTIPIYTGREPISGKRTLLVGDAAGLADPLSGEGIRFAIKSGKLAARTILSGKVSQYSKLVDKEIGRSHRFGYALAYFFYTFPEISFALGARNPFATDALIKMFSDRIGYGEVIFRLIGTLPIYLSTEIIGAVAKSVAGPTIQKNIRKTVYGREI